MSLLSRPRSMHSCYACSRARWTRFHGRQLPRGKLSEGSRFHCKLNSARTLPSFLPPSRCSLTPAIPPRIVMAPRKRAQSQAVDPAQAPGDNVKKPRVAAHTANSNSKKRKRVSDRPDEAETSQVNQVRTRRPRWGRVVGRLAGLMEMPMDILFEVRP